MRGASLLKFTAVIPVYNHEQAVPAVVAALRALRLPVVLVDDGSDESCRRVLEQLAQDENVQLVRLPRNGGKGAAVIAGLRAAQRFGFTHALQVDADGQHDLGDAAKFIEAARREPHAVICGRPVFDASMPRVRFVSRHITHALVWLETLSFTRVPDSMCGFRLYPVARVLEVVDRDRIGRRMDFDVELLVKLVWREYELRWIPTRVSYPTDGVSHYRLFRDNLWMAGMHVRLLLGAAWRAPRIVGRRLRRQQGVAP